MLRDGRPGPGMRQMYCLLDTEKRKDLLVIPALRHLILRMSDSGTWNVRDTSSMASLSE